MTDHVREALFTLAGKVPAVNATSKPEASLSAIAESLRAIAVAELTLAGLDVDNNLSALPGTDESTEPDVSLSVIAGILRAVAIARLTAAEARLP